ncbi:histone acetyltransferase-like protein [Melanomma pulvis-pyrius CBS 109.77]|uniref:Histone acetyltransferase-like protein n=1 Tax=Melanomma pulvis-pyrius CBS 109.77 TaxID=1314802 RepID=A0A6A6WRI1_9PLEO|nr:histone acetyltransferase-like protein [Melanomma pulvis-pyrius CBS 109.77]
MPAMLDDPTSLPILRSHPTPALAPQHVTLKDGQTKATILPFTSLSQAAPPLVAYLCAQLALEIGKGDTYPMVEALPLEAFGPYWFGTFAAVMLLGDFEDVAGVAALEGVEWSAVCLGSFYVKPNYPGRSSHVCNGGFIVTEASRNRGVGKLLGRAYLEWAPKLGYAYSVFNLVYETNVASCRIWDSLGFERIGRVRKCGKLKSYPERKVDAIVYGYDFEPDVEAV